MKKWVPILIVFSIISCVKKNNESIKNKTNDSLKVEKVVSQEKPHEVTLDEAIVEIIKAYQQKDNVKINSYINKKYGITFLYARGAFNNIGTSEDFSFAQPVPDYLPYVVDFKTNYKITHSTLPEFDCGTETWNKPVGIYVDTKKHDKTLSSVAKSEVEYIDKDAWSNAEIMNFEEIENNSHKVILISKDQDAFIFYVAPIDGKYYLTAIDRFEVCSA